MPVDLGESVTIVNAREVQGRLLEALRGDGPVSLDASALREVDVAGLQLLCATHRLALSSGRAVSFAGSPHPDFVAAARAAGFGPGRGCPADCLCAGGRR